MSLYLYDEEKDELVIDTSKYKDTGAFVLRTDLSPEQNEQIKEQIILNSINVLMKRGIQGLYIYATDPTPVSFISEFVDCVDQALDIVHDHFPLSNSSSLFFNLGSVA